MKIAYKYRIYPTKEQEKILNQYCYTYNLLQNIGTEIVRTYIVREQRLSGKTKTVKSKKDKSEMTFPVYKYPSKIDIHNMIYHLKDEIDNEWWGYIQSEKTLERKDELKKLFSELSSTCFSPIADAIRNGIDAKFNPNIAKPKKDDEKKKRQKTLTVDGIEEIDYTGLNFHKFYMFNCSFSTRCQNQTALKTTDTKKAFFNLPKIGLVKMIYHRPIPNNSKFDCVTISKKGDHWYISLGGLTIEEKKMINKEQVLKSVGIDKNTDNYMVTSDNDSFKNPVQKLKKLNKKIKRLQRRNGENKKNATCKSKRDYKSKNYKKYLIKFNKLNERITNIKKDILNKATSKLTDNYDAIFVEDLSVKAMQQYNGKMTQKNNFYEFDRMLNYKSVLKGKLFGKIGRFYASSQICSKCGQVHPEMRNLNKRIFKCDCGNIISRDLNAAINIHSEGLKLLQENKLKK